MAGVDGQDMDSIQDVDSVQLSPLGRPVCLYSSELYRHRQLIK